MVILFTVIFKTFSGLLADHADSTFDSTVNIANSD